MSAYGLQQSMPGDAPCTNHLAQPETKECVAGTTATMKPNIPPLFEQ